MSDEELIAMVPVVVAPCASVAQGGTTRMHRSPESNAEREVTHAR